MARRKLAGKLCAITGGARGIGRATAMALLRKGARVVIGDIDGEVALGTARELSHLGGIYAYPLDVTQRVEFEAFVDRIERELGEIDVLVNNAGIMSLGGFLEHDESNDRKQIEVNLFGVLHGMRAVIPRMKARRSGHVVNVASLAGRAGIAYAATYSATKFAVIGVTESVRAEMRGFGIDFSYVMPYLVRTDLTSGTRGLKWPPIVEAEEVAGAIVGALESRRVEVYVPAIGRLGAILPAVLPRRALDWLGGKLGVDRLFQRVDAESRAAYIARTTGSAGVIEGTRPLARNGHAREPRRETPGAGEPHR